MKIKNLLDFFYYTKSERRGVAILLLLCTGVFIAPYFYAGPPPEVPKMSNQELVVNASFSSPMKSRTYTKSSFHHWQKRKVRHFIFDPNQVSKEELLELGVTPKVAAIWQKYLNKGGSFRKTEDVQRVYGVSERLYEELKPYIQIQQKRSNFTYEDSKPDYKRKNWENRSYPEAAPNPKTFGSERNFTPRTRKPCEPLDINQSDTSAWDRLPGIGRVLAARITKYREKLGGFYRIEQIAETYGLADSVFQKIRPCLQLSNPDLKPISLNQATFAELNAHPYIDFRTAKAILAYRDQHGKFSSVEELREVKALPEGAYEKLLPYLKI
jgi:DNA uptake protein ComE-like DNA-binding protein